MKAMQKFCPVLVLLAFFVSLGLFLSALKEAVAFPELSKDGT